MKHRKRLLPQLNGAEPVPPWSVRRVRLCKLILANVALRANTGGGVGTTRGDMHRLIKEGYARMTLQQGERWSARFHITFRYVMLTPKGYQLAGINDWVEKKLLRDG